MYMYMVHCLPSAENLLPTREPDCGLEERLGRWLSEREGQWLSSSNCCNKVCSYNVCTHRSLAAKEIRLYHCRQHQSFHLSLSHHLLQHIFVTWNSPFSFFESRFWCSPCPIYKEGRHVNLEMWNVFSRELAWEVCYPTQYLTPSQHLQYPVELSEY